MSYALFILTSNAVSILDVHIARTDHLINGKKFSHIDKLNEQ